MPESQIKMIEAQTEPCPACASLLDVTGAQIFAERTCPVCGTPINVRRKFGHYELMSVVGSGGQGVVYRAVDNTLNRLVALKLLRTECSEDPEFVKQFESEAHLTASINHPNVVRVYSFGADEGHVFLAMELVDKGTLDELMERHTRVPEARALQIGIEIAQGLRAGSEKGLIHRDVKPGNILFSQEGTSKIVDFGLAMFFEQAAQEKGEIWGTPYYLSPERLNKAAEDFRSDIYSLGATLFHAIAGRPPFEAQDASHVALKHLRAQAVSLQAFAPDVCNATAYVINRTLSKDPAERQQTYDELIEQLQFAREEALQRARGGGRQQKTRVVLEDQSVQKAMSWVTLATLIVLVGTLIVGVLLVVKIFKGDEPPPVPQEVAAATIDSFGPGWPEAKQALLAGEYGRALQAFTDLAGKHGEGTPERAWARVNQALAAALSGRMPDAEAALGQLQGGGTQVSRFFSEQVAPKLAGSAPIPGTVARNLNKTNHEVLAALFYGVKDYNLGAVDDARTFISHFTGMDPERNLAWLADYKKLAKPLQDEFVTFSLAADAWTLARNSKDRAIAITALRDLPGRLPSGSKLIPQAKELLATAEKQLADELAERMKRNLAYKAKATANTSDEKKGDTPERAVDGDPKTRWIGRVDGEKWLALDLGSAKQISRWVVKTAGSNGEKQDLNFTSVTLQRSDDGSKWTDVDTVKDNRSDIVDRVVPPFTARHVRLWSNAGGSKKGDDGLRVCEFELGAAGDQANADYEADTAVAFRFSLDTEMLAGPVGDPGVAGTVKYDAKAGRFSIRGGGEDIWTNSDNFHFVWQPVAGDCEIVARIVKVERTQEWTKAGVMIRSGFAKDASHATMAGAPDAKIQFLTRKTPGGQARSDNKTGIPLPRWLKLTRTGATITGYESADGKAWTEVGSETLDGIEPLAFVGLAVCSHVKGRLTTAEFDNVTITKK